MYSPACGRTLLFAPRRLLSYASPLSDCHEWLTPAGTLWTGSKGGRGEAFFTMHDGMQRFCTPLLFLVR